MLVIPQQFGGLVIPRARGASDPFFSSVECLLHFDGSDGSTTFTDSSKNNLTILWAGNAQIDTAHSKFGGASCLLDNASYIYNDAHATAFDLPGDFTIEFFIRPAAQTGSQPYGIVDFRTSNGGHEPVFFRGSDNRVHFWIADGDRAIGPVMTNGQWYHVAMTRSGSTVRFFFDGVQQGSNFSNSTAFSNGRLTIGVFVNDRSTSTNFHFSGHIDEFRYTKGVARYTSNFSVPTQPFPNR